MDLGNKRPGESALGRFDRLFALCEQEMRTPVKRRRITKRDAEQDRNDAEAFRQAAIQSLLRRPIG